MAAPMKAYNLFSCRNIHIAKRTVCFQAMRSKNALSRKCQGLRGVVLTSANRTAFYRFLRCYATFDEQACWKCQRPLVIEKERFFCDCGVVQPPVGDSTYFELFKLEKSFDIDISSLTKLFRRLQMLLHPDKYAQKSSVEMEYSASQSSMLNKAYSTLLDPLQRGIYLLNLEGDSIPEAATSADHEFLMEIMEINERLAKVQSAGELQDIDGQNQNVISDTCSKISTAFKSRDSEQAKALLVKLKYFRNIDDKIKEIRRKQMDI